MGPRGNKPKLLSWILLATSLFWAGQSHAGPRADYMIHCQGCHVGDGSGFPGKVPDVRDTIPALLESDGGRAFLVQVPGSAQAALSDSKLAGVLNWMVTTLSREPVKAFAPYTEAEIATARATPLIDVTPVRDKLLAQGKEADHRPAE